MGTASAITNAVVASHLNGLSQRAIAKQHKVSERTVTEILRNRGYLQSTGRRQSTTKAETGRFHAVPAGLVDAYMEEPSIRAVGKRFDVPSSTVRLMLLREGVTLRPAVKRREDLSQILDRAGNWMRTESLKAGAEASLFNVLATWLAVESQAAALVIKAGQFDPADFYPAIAFVAELPFDPTLKVLAEYLSGVSIPDVAERHECSYGKARQQLVAHKVRFRRTRGLSVSPPGMADAYTSGMTVTEVADKFDLKPDTAYKMLLRAGVSMRPAARRPMPDADRKSRRGVHEMKRREPRIEFQPPPQQVPISVNAMNSGLKQIYRDAGSIQDAAAILRIGALKMRKMLSEAGIAIYRTRAQRPQGATRRHCDEDEE